MIEQIKHLFCLIWIFIFIFRLHALIVFDGTNSFSTYTGTSESLKTITGSKPKGTIVRLQDIDPGQIDYTTSDSSTNRSNITDEEGMIIEAEGFYSFKAGKRDGRISRTGGVGYRVARTPGCSLTFNIAVKEPGIYTFALDGSVGAKPKQEIPLVRLSTVDKMYQQTEAQGSWKANYTTGNWGTIVKNYGGKGPEDPYFTKLFLNTGNIALILDFEAKRRIIQVDAIRVVGFEKRGNAFEKYQQKQEKKTLMAIKKNINQMNPPIMRPEGENFEYESIFPFMLISITIIPVFITLVSIGLWIEKKNRAKH